uniref:Uncharacterized protein n=1 Tax=Arion vulgaris TaxID=1028688 RepID=A0A0B6Z454_9EUPU
MPVSAENECGMMALTKAILSWASGYVRHTAPIRPIMAPDAPTDIENGRRNNLLAAILANEENVPADR